MEEERSRGQQGGEDSQNNNGQNQPSQQPPQQPTEAPAAGRRRRRDAANRPNAGDIEEEGQQAAGEAPEEAEEVADVDDDAPAEEEGEGEDLMENMDKDYEAIPELDKYEAEGIDENEYEPINEEQKREAEEVLRRRDVEQLAAQRRVPAALLEADQESDLEEDLREAIRRSRQRAAEADLALDEGEDEEGDERHLDIEEVKGKLPEWINEARTQRWIRRAFKKFLLNFKEANGALIYEQRIHEMCAHNKQSLEINPTHLQRMYPSILLWILESPTIILPILNAVAFDLARHMFPGYENIHGEIFVRLKEWPILTELRDLRKVHLNQMVKIIGVVTRRGAVYSQLKKVYYICGKCGERLGPLFVNEHTEGYHLGACPVCQAKGPFSIDSEFTVYRNYQRVTVQETPGKVPPGRVPRHKDVILLADNIDVARPGDEVEIVGIFTNQLDYSLNVKHGFPVFATILEANYIKRVAESQITELPDEDKYEIRKLAKTHPNVGKLIANSIAPSIYGHNHVKMALALAMFGGEAKDWAGKHRIRGDINCLLLGDPGTAKSQFLKYIEKTFHRTVYTTGKGASAVGLTALVHRDPSTREWTLEGGALVLADKGICLIDEFDKMSDHDRTSIHEAMEQQTISISKAGIIANLQARCSVIAAANPIKGRYDSQLSFAENVDLSDTILSRFDILCVVKDEVDVNSDTALATFVINSHIKSHPTNDKGREDTVKDLLLEDSYGNSTRDPNLIPQDLLKKYILYARQFVKPQLTEINKEKITNFFGSLRQESQTSGGIPVYHRHLEAIIRMAEAHARMNLRDNVRDDDVDVAISVLLESFIQTQKTSVAKLIRKKFSTYLTFKDENTFLLLNLLNKLIREKIQYRQLVRSAAETHEIKVLKEELEEAARELQIFDLSEFYGSSAFRRNYQTKGNIIVKEIFT